MTVTLAALIADSNACPLRLVRVARGLTQRELERVAGLSPTTVSHYESGRRQPDPATALRLSMALDVPREELFPHADQRRF